MHRRVQGVILVRPLTLKVGTAKQAFRKPHSIVHLPEPHGTIRRFVLLDKLPMPVLRS